MKTNGTKPRRSQKELAVERLIENIDGQIARHQIAIEELDALKTMMRQEELDAFAAIDESEESRIK